MTTKAHITNWIPVTEATAVIKQMIEDGKFTKKQIKKSSYRWADTKDHSKGYLCRVEVEAGVQPELEMAPLARGRKKIEQLEEVAKQVKAKTKKSKKAKKVADAA